MNWIDKLERKFGRFAVHNLTLYLIMFSAFGFALQMTSPMFYQQYLSLNAERILHGEIWRIVTYLIYPLDGSVLFLALMSFIYYSLGRFLEQLWGTFRFNLYMIIGILGNVLAAIIIYLLFGIVALLHADQLYMAMILGFAMTVPEMEFRLYFAIPVKVKWLGIFYVVMLVLNFIQTSLPGKIAIVMSVLNVILFFFAIKKPAQQAKVIKRQHEFKKKVQESTPKMEYRHRCAVCGRTELDDPTLEFRYCSRCAGNFEYCKEHLFTHVHVTEDKLMH